MSGDFAVIGLGQFGRAVALSLVREGAAVLAIDQLQERAQMVEAEVDAVACADATNELALEELGARITAIDGVKDTTFANWFGGAYQKPENQVFSFAVAPNYLDIYPEMEVSAEHRKAFADTKNGALVGEGLARKFGWKVGDTVPMQSTIFPDKNGSQNWPFQIVGVIIGCIVVLVLMTYQIKRKNCW